MGSELEVQWKVNKQLLLPLLPAPPQAPHMEEDEDCLPHSFPNFFFPLDPHLHTKLLKRPKNSNSKLNTVNHLFLPCQEFLVYTTSIYHYYVIILSLYAIRCGGVMVWRCGGVCLFLPIKSPNPIFFFFLLHLPINLQVFATPFPSPFHVQYGPSFLTPPPPLWFFLPLAVSMIPISLFFFQVVF